MKVQTPKTILIKVLGFSAVVVALLFTLAPFLWTVLTSFKLGSELFVSANASEGLWGVIWPKTLSFANYQSVFREQPFGRHILNSAFVATLATLLSLFLGVSASYALARREFAGRRLVLISFLLISMFPQIAVLSGLFEVLRTLGLFNNLLGLVLSYMIITLPFTVWVLTTFMRQIPRGLEEAAIMDGASSFTIVTRIFLPLLLPAMVTTGLLAFIAAWNEFLFALTFTLSDDARTVPVAIASMSGSSQYELPWGNITAAAVVVTLPLIVLVLLFQRRIVSGLTAGAMKG